MAKAKIEEIKLRIDTGELIDFETATVWCSGYVCSVAASWLPPVDN